VINADGSNQIRLANNLMGGRYPRRLERKRNSPVSAYPARVVSAVLSSAVGCAETALVELSNRKPPVIAGRQSVQKSRRECFG